MLKLTKPLLVTALLMAAGCAAAPETIPPAYVSPTMYGGWTCEQIAAEQSRLVETLTTLTEQQRRARANDTAGVVLIGLPLASMRGRDQAPQIALQRGQQQALDVAAREKGCPLAPPAPPAQSDNTGK